MGLLFVLAAASAKYWNLGSATLNKQEKTGRTLLAAICWCQIGSRKMITIHYDVLAYLAILKLKSVQSSQPQISSNIQWFTETFADQLSVSTAFHREQKKVIESSI
jgi:hypothetical protein